MNAILHDNIHIFEEDRLDCISVSIVYCAIQVATGAEWRTAASSCVYFVREREEATWLKQEQEVVEM